MHKGSAGIMLNALPTYYVLNYAGITTQAYTSIQILRETPLVLQLLKQNVTWDIPGHHIRQVGR